jgi:Zn-dependent peptidase ImmA (M78 family)
MHIPSEISVMGQTVTIRMLSDADMAGNCGLSQAYSNSIKINNSLPPDKQGHTFLHELLHQMDDMLKLKMKHDTIDVLSMAMYQVLKENNINFKE